LNWNIKGKLSILNCEQLSRLSEISCTTITDCAEMLRNGLNLNNGKVVVIFAQT